jgi:hypothetical protein
VAHSLLRSWFLAASLVLSACTGGSGSLEVDEEGRTVVGEVRLAVPDGWEAADEEPPLGVLEAQRWRPPGAELTGLQLVVACEGTLDELVEGVVRSGRGGLRVVDAAEAEGFDVPGLDATRTLALDLEGTLAGVDAGQLRTAGLYGQAGDALLLLELTQRAEDLDLDLAERIFGSVTVDGDGLGDRCEAG